ncbi:MAG: sensor domain-containing diguanylate cyclase [Calditrichia bacterium]
MESYPKMNGIEKEGLMACLEIGKSLTSTFDLKEILHLVMQKISQLIPAQNWSLLLRDESTGDLCFHIAVGIDQSEIMDQRIAEGEGIAGRVAQNGEMMIVINGDSDQRIHRKIDQLTGFHTQSIIALPLKTRDEVLGVLEIVNFPDPESFREKYLTMAQILADYAAVAIQNSRYYSRIQHLSITDEYTGLYNTRYLHDKLENLISEADDKNEPIAVVFVDVDNFKRVVDTHGHLEGSQVLKEVGEVMLQTLGERDILIKYGGDEFVIIMPGRDKDSAKSKAEAVLQKIRGSRYLTDTEEPVQVSASFGIAVYPQDADSKKLLLLQADHSMYRIKKSTKNGVGTCD